MNPKVKSKLHFSGRHDSPLLGSSPDFMEYRHYYQGEDAKNVDWKASLKTGKTLVRQMEHQAQINHWFICDSSESMCFPKKGERNKYDIQLILVGVFIHLFSGQGDAAGLSMLQNNQCVFLDPKKTKSGITQLLSTLYNYTPIGSETQIDLINTCINKIRKPSVFWIFCDFDHDPEKLLEKIKLLKQQQQDVRVIHLFHPEEKELSWRGRCLFKDIEEELEDQRVYPEQIEQAYKEVYKEHCNLIRNFFKRHSIPYCHFNMNASLSDQLIKFIAEDISYEEEKGS